MSFAQAVTPDAKRAQAGAVGLSQQENLGIWPLKRVKIGMALRKMGFSSFGVPKLWMGLHIRLVINLKSQPD